MELIIMFICIGIIVFGTIFMLMKLEERQNLKELKEHFKNFPNDIFLSGDQLTDLLEQNGITIHRHFFNLHYKCKLSEGMWVSEFNEMINQYKKASSFLHKDYILRQHLDKLEIIRY